MHTWEPVPSNGRFAMARLQVPGGWIYYAYSTSGVTATFVPDTNSESKGK